MLNPRNDREATIVSWALVIAVVGLALHCSTKNNTNVNFDPTSDFNNAAAGDCEFINERFHKRCNYELQKRQAEALENINENLKVMNEKFFPTSCASNSWCAYPPTE